MLRLITYSGYTIYVRADTILRVQDCGPNSQGIRSVVRLLDGTIIECGYTADEVFNLMSKESK